METWQEMAEYEARLALRLVPRIGTMDIRGSDGVTELHEELVVEEEQDL